MSATVLVIDDDRVIRLMAQAMLSRKGYHVFTAESVQQAWEIIHNQTTPDLIFCDLMMPTISGIDFLQCDERHQSLANVPVIVISAAGNSQLMDEAHQSGAFRCLNKPFTQNQLASAINEALVTAVIPENN